MKVPDPVRDAQLYDIVNKTWNTLQRFHINASPDPDSITISMNNDLFNELLALDCRNFTASYIHFMDVTYIGRLDSPRMFGFHVQTGDLFLGRDVLEITIRVNP